MKTPFLSAKPFLMSAFLLPALLLPGSLAAPPVAAAPLVDGLVKGEAQIPSVAGRPSEKMLPLGGAMLYVTPVGDGVGLARYCPDGDFQCVVPPGDYVALLEPGEDYRRGRIIEGLRVGIGELTWNPTLKPDYNTIFERIEDWHQEPWTWGKTLEQTFIARGTGITSAALKVAGVNDSDSLEVTVLDGPGGEPIGPARTVKAQPIADLSVEWEPGEVPTTPGETYALRIQPTAEAGALGLFTKREIGWGYPFGGLTVDGEERPLDGYLYIGSNNDGTLLTVDRRGDNTTAAPAARWTQSFTATGDSLAAAASVVFVSDPGLGGLRISVEQDGKTVGIAREMKPLGVAVFPSLSGYRGGVAWAEGAVPLKPGEDYTLVVESTDGKPFAPVTDKQKNLVIRLYEYDSAAPDYVLPPIPDPEPLPGEETMLLRNPGFETGDLTAWEGAWAGESFDAVIGADWKPGHFSGESARPAEGEHCAVVVAEDRPVRRLIRYWLQWPEKTGEGLIHARVRVAHSDKAGENAAPLQVRLCISANGSPDAGGVNWSPAVVSPGEWSVLQSYPVVPQAQRMSVFLLVEGGAEGEANVLKVDQLEVVIDE